MVNYTTIRKQMPSLDRSLDSNDSAIKILKYPKVANESSVSSKSGSRVNATLNKRNLTDKSLNLTQLKPTKDSKVIRFSKDLKQCSKKASKQKQKEGVSKCEIDLSKLHSATSSRGQTHSLSKEYHTMMEEIKSISSHKSKSPERQEVSSGRDELFPMPPGKALKLYMSSDLNAFEQGEILDYKLIYFISKTKDKIDGSKLKTNNNGYDDNRGDYKIVIGDHIAYRYEILETLGQGSFGQVIKVFDHKAKKNLALKIIRNKKKFEYQAKVEIKVLKDIKEHDLKEKSNIIKLFNNFMFRKHICLTFELFSINLYELIKSNDYNGFPLDIIRRFAVQILQGLRFLKKRNIIH